MASTWGTSWGSAWGDSWGALEAAVSGTPAESAGGSILEWINPPSLLGRGHILDLHFVGTSDAYAVGEIFKDSGRIWAYGNAADVRVEPRTGRHLRAGVTGTSPTNTRGAVGTCLVTINTASRRAYLEGLRHA